MSGVKIEHVDEPAKGSFANTRWSLIAAVKSPGHVGAAAALETLCAMYWYPLYCYARRRNFPPSDAEDLVQGYFAALLERDLFARADPARGKLRALLLSSLQDFIADHWKRAGAAKRGGGMTFVHFDATAAEDRYALEPADFDSPDRLYEHRWAVAMAERATEVLGEMWRSQGKGEIFQALQPHLLARLESEDAKQIAERFGMSENHVKVSLHRLRERFREVLRRELAGTVGSEAEVEEELALIRSAVG